MSNKGPLKDRECFIPPITRESELRETLRVLEENLAYDEEHTITPEDLEVEFDTEIEVDKIVERDVHVCEMNRKLREKLTHRIGTIQNVLDKDYDELMEEFKGKSKKKFIGDFIRLMEEESPEMVFIQRDENEGGIGFIALTLDSEGSPIPRAMPTWMLTATLTRDQRLIRYKINIKD